MGYKKIDSATKIKVASFAKRHGVRAAAENFGYSRGTVHVWYKEYILTGTIKQSKGLDNSYNKRMQNYEKVGLKALLKIMNDDTRLFDLKRYSSKKERFKIVDRLRAEVNYDVKDACKKLGVSRSGFYHWVKNRSEYNNWDKELAKIILKVHSELPFYGYRRISAHLKWEKGLIVTESVVRRYMKELGIKSKAQKKKLFKRTDFRTTAKNKLLNSEGKRLLRNAKSSNEVWHLDITQIKIKGGRALKVFVAIDQHDRRVASYFISLQERSRQVIEALEKSYDKSMRGKLMLHSDNGAQFISFEYLDFCERKGLRPPSYSRPRNPHDNALAEIFFRWMKAEIRSTDFIMLDLEGAKRKIEDYINFYNERRVQDRIGGVPPMQFYRENKKET